MTFSKRGANTQYCQSWKDLTPEEKVRFHADKVRATCHLAKGHLGDHKDHVLGLGWGMSGWPNNRPYVVDGS
jgi:hypothetical protein